MHTLMVADDHPLFRDALNAVIQAGLPGCELREAESLESLHASLSDCDDVDLVLLDLNLPDTTGLDGLQQIRQSFPDIAVAVLSADSDRRTVLGALELGAVGYVPKSTPRPDLICALHQILDGQVYVPVDILRRPAAVTAVNQPKTEQALSGQLDRLTDKQLEVLLLLVRGASNKLIGRQLGIAETTVKTHVSAILAKLGVSGRVQAVLAADEALLISCIQQRQRRRSP